MMKSVSIGQRMAIVFGVIFIGLVWFGHDLRQKSAAASQPSNRSQIQIVSSLEKYRGQDREHAQPRTCILHAKAALEVRPESLELYNEALECLTISRASMTSPDQQRVWNVVAKTAGLDDILFELPAGPGMVPKIKNATLKGTIQITLHDQPQPIAR